MIEYNTQADYIDWQNSPEFRAFRLELDIACAYARNALPPFGNPNKMRLGEIVEPEHMEQGIYVKERRHVVSFIRNYGVVAQTLCTSNGSLSFLLRCVNIDAFFIPSYGLYDDD